MKLARTVAGAVLAAAAVGGATTGLLQLGTAGATSGRRAEVDAQPAGTATCTRPLAALSQTLGLPAAQIRLHLRTGDTLAQLATAQGVDRQAVVDTLTAVGDAAIDRGVATGRLTDEQAATRKAALPARVAAAVDNPITRDGHRRRAGGGRPAVAAALGISLPELRQARAAGESIADIAEAHGLDPQQVIDTLVARSTERITALVNGEAAASNCG